MKTFKILVAGVALLAATSSFATVVLPGSETPLQTIIDNMYSCGTCSGVAAAPDVNLNQSPDETFQVEASGGSISTMVIEVAGHAGTNQFGVYDINNPSVKVMLFDGAVTAGGQVTLKVNSSLLFKSYDEDGTIASATFSSASYGYYLYDPTTGHTFYSQAALNVDGADQMVGYKGDGDTVQLTSSTLPAVWGPSSYLLAWEDMMVGYGSDQDYNDMVVYVESVTVPEPGSLALLGLGLIGLAATARRKFRA